MLLSRDTMEDVYFYMKREYNNCTFRGVESKDDGTKIGRRKKIY